MLGAHAASSPRVTGDDAVLGLMARVGRNPRVFANLVEAGFPEPQLLHAREHFVRGAETPVEHHAARRMSQGYFDDEDLLSLFCRFYDCQDWRLESSSLFFARQEYERFFDALTTPVGFETRLLTEGGGQETWEGFFPGEPSFLQAFRVVGRLTALFVFNGTGGLLTKAWDQFAASGP